MVNFLNLPTVQAPRNALVDLSPIGNAIDGNRRNALMVQEGQRQDQQLAMQRENQQYQRGRDQKQDSRADVEWFAKQAAAVDQLQGPARVQAYQGLLARHPGRASLTPEYLDPINGPKLIMAEAGQFRDPREDQLKDLEIKRQNAQIGLIGAQTAAASRRGSPDVDQRVSDLKRFSIDPSSPEGQMYIFNGKMPSKAYDNKAYVAKQDGTITGIEKGLENLNTKAAAYDDSSFANAVGPIQGSTPDSLLGSIPVNVARIAGEVGNWWEGGKTAPSEVRSTIMADTETLAAAIKPLIRKPGEGVWTDQDQARLVSIVGDLSQARDKPEFKRRLNNVRDRLKANFNLDINFDALGGQQPNALPQPGEVIDGHRFKGGNPGDKQNWEPL